MKQKLNHKIYLSGRAFIKILMSCHMGDSFKSRIRSFLGDLARFGLIGVASISSGCSWFSGKEVNPGQTASQSEQGARTSNENQNIQSVNQKNRDLPLSAKFTTAQDRRVKNLIQLLTQADQIHREVLWILLKDRPPQGKSFFGKTQRALVQSRGQKLTGKSAFRCDVYDVTFQSGKLTGLPLSFMFFEKCSKSMAAKKFAELKMSTEGKFSVFYETEALEEVVGLGSAILNKRMNCEVRLQGEAVISQMSCDLVLHDKSSDEIFELKKYIYSSGENALISIEGNLLKNLVPQRKINLEVPLVGKIKLSELELIPEPQDPRLAQDEIDLKNQKEALGPGAKPLPNETSKDSLQENSAAEFTTSRDGPSRGNVVDPDIQKAREQMAQPPVRIHPNLPEGAPLVDEQGYPLTQEQIQEIKAQQELQNQQTQQSPSYQMPGGNNGQEAIQNENEQNNNQEIREQEGLYQESSSPERGNQESNYQENGQSNEDRNENNQEQDRTESQQQDPRNQR